MGRRKAETLKEEEEQEKEYEKLKEEGNKRRLKAEERDAMY